MNYRIHWKALRTGATGWGTGTFSKLQAEEFARALNAQEREKPIADQLIEHWVQEEKE